MSRSNIQIAVQKAGEIIYVSTSKADAQVYMNLSRGSLERMLEEGCEIQGFTADEVLEAI